MELFLKSAAGVLIALILYFTLSKFEKNYALMLTVFVCALILIGTFAIMDPIVDFLRQLQEIGNIDENILKIIYKTIGIGLLSEIVGMLCKDAGNEAMGKSLNIMATILMIRISIPVLNQMITLIKAVLEKL